LGQVRRSNKYHLELRWDGLGSLQRGLEMIRDQARRTPEGQWVRVMGGWSPYQFTEKRMPAAAELTSAAPRVPVLVLFGYSQALLNRAGAAALGLSSGSEQDRPPLPPAAAVAPPMTDFPFETTRTGVQLVLNGILDRYPGLRIILSHAGGFLPYASLRFAELARVFQPGAPGPDAILASFRRFYFDTALSTGPAVPTSHRNAQAFSPGWPSGAARRLRSSAAADHHISFTGTRPARGSRPYDAIRRRPAVSSLPGRALPGRARAVAGRGALPREATLAGCVADDAGGTGVPDVAICRTT
jgi:Amidohydrolase family